MSTSNYDAMFGGTATASVTAHGERRTTRRTAEDFDQMFAEADRSAMENRRAAARSKGTIEDILEATGSGVPTGKDFRREEAHK